MRVNIFPAVGKEQARLRVYIFNISKPIVDMPLPQNTIARLIKELAAEIKAVEEEKQDKQIYTTISDQQVFKKFKELVAQEFDIEKPDIMGKRRDRNFVIPRQVLAYLAKEFCIGWSIPTIGKKMNKDHSTIIYSANKISEQLQTNYDLNERIAVIIDNFEKWKLDERHRQMDEHIFKAVA